MTATRDSVRVAVSEMYQARSYSPAFQKEITLAAALEALEAIYLQRVDPTAAAGAVLAAARTLGLNNAKPFKPVHVGLTAQEWAARMAEVAAACDHYWNDDAFACIKCGKVRRGTY